ncbi:MAG: TlpA disulfide reductase family protein [Patescibacteria group bacterium]
MTQRSYRSAKDACRDVLRAVRSVVGANLLMAVLAMSVLMHRFRPDIQALLGGKGDDSLIAPPRLVVATLAGDTIALDELRGQVVLLTYFASWCGACRREMPGIEGVQRKRIDRGLVTIGLSTDRTVAAATAFVVVGALSFPVAMAGDAERAWFGVVSVPTTVIIDREGQVRHQFRGEISQSALGLALDRLLAEGPSPQAAGVVR